MISTIRAAMVVFLAVTALAGCRDEPADSPAELRADTVRVAPSNTVITAAREAGLSTFETAVVASGLGERLHGEGPFTVFGPTNAAFDRLGGAMLDTLLADDNRDQLSSYVLYHIVAGRLETNAVDGVMTYQTLQGGSLSLERTAEGVFVSDPSGTRARVVTPDLNRGNGVLHVIDAVLTPSVVADTTG